MSRMTVSVDVSATLADELCRLSQESGREISVLAQEAMADYVQCRNWEIEIVEEAVRASEDGAFISNDAMIRWLKSWGTKDELPPPEPDVFKSSPEPDPTE